MYKKKLGIYSVLSAILAVLIIAGCEGLISGTFVVEQMFRDIDPDESLYTYEVDYSEETAWEEHGDEISHIDDVGFQLWMQGPAGDTAELYVADSLSPEYTTVNDVKDNATVIVSNLVIPSGGNLYVDWPTSQSHVENLDELKDCAMEGKFTIYGVVSDPEVAIDSINVIVTLTY
jgi:hypothetical protein